MEFLDKETNWNEELVSGPIKRELRELKSSLQQNISVPDALRVAPHIMPPNKPAPKTEVSGKFLWEEKWAAPWEKSQYRVGVDFGYLNMYRKLSDEDYNKLFSGFIDVRQWFFWDCYLVSTIKSLARSRYFDTLMITSIQKNEDWSYDLYLPLWKSNWKKVHISKEELNLAKIKWPDGYKILEVWFAKEASFKGSGALLYPWDIHDMPLTEESMNHIVGWNSYTALATLLWQSNIIRKIISNKPERRNLIINTLEKFDPRNLNLILISSNRRPKSIPSTQKTYTVEGQKMYYHHAYSLYAVQKIGENISNITIEDPANNKKKITLSLLWFMRAFSQLTTCSPKPWFLSVF